MARSSYVYVFTDAETGKVAATFTVKHEAATWYHYRRPADSVVKLERFRDGGPRGSYSEGTPMDPEALDG